MDCIFCAIAKGDIPSKKVYEDEKIIAFEDITPQAPIHVLVVPKKHGAHLLEFSPEEIGEIHGGLLEVARILDLENKGFRLVVNTGATAGQTVDHLHYHLLSGRNLQWPPG